PGVFSQVFDQRFEFFGLELFFEGLGHHVGGVALGDLRVRVDDRFFDLGFALAGEDFVEVRAGGAAGIGGGERVAATAAVVGEDLGAGAAFDFRRRRPGHTRVLAEVGGDVVEVLALGGIGGHRGGRIAVRGAGVV